MSEKTFNLIGTLLALGAGMLAQKLISALWRGVIGEPPEDPDDPDTNLGEALSWAVASGAAVAVVKIMTTREVKKYYNASTTPLQRAGDGANT